MLITYFDEVKYQKGRQPYYWLGGICVSAATIRFLEENLNGLAETVFGTRRMSRDTEFHAADIMNGHEHFKGWAWDKRIDLLKSLTSIFGAAQEIGKIYVRLEPARMIATDDVEGTAFMYFIERVDGYLRAQKESGLLIGDRENDVVSGKFSENLSGYKETGTSFQFGRKLTHLIDTVHFTHSHHSRMLQLADLHVWLRQLYESGDQGKWHRKQIIDHIQSVNDCLYANKYKIWPTKDSWVKVEL